MYINIEILIRKHSQKKRKLFFFKEYRDAKRFTKEYITRKKKRVHIFFLSLWYGMVGDYIKKKVSYPKAYSFVKKNSLFYK